MNNLSAFDARISPSAAITWNCHHMDIIMIITLVCGGNTYGGFTYR